MELETIKQQIGVKLKLFRVSLGLNQTEFALALDTSQNEVSTWENGKKFIPWAVAYKMSSVYGLNFELFNVEKENGKIHRVKPNNNKPHNNLPVR